MHFINNKLKEHETGYKAIPQFMADYPRSGMPYKRLNDEKTKRNLLIRYINMSRKIPPVL